MIPYELLKYQAADFDRLAGHAGLTGWWQINGRSTVDFQQMVDVAFNGTYEPGQQFIAPGSYYHDETLPPKTRDVEGAKKLLAEAGKEGFTFEMLVRPDRDYQVPAVCEMSP